MNPATAKYERGAEQGKQRDTFAGIHQESKELEKDQRCLEEMLLDPDWISPGNTQCFRAMLATIRKMKSILLRLEMKVYTSTKIFWSISA